MLPWKILPVCPSLRGSCLAGYSWSSVFSSIKGDLSDLRSSVSKGASDLYTYVKDSVPEGSNRFFPLSSRIENSKGGRAKGLFILHFASEWIHHFHRDKGEGGAR